jgi:pilus assembly protein CpaB
MNLENKKQITILSLAIGLGIVAASIIGKVVNEMVRKQSEAITADVQQKNAGLINELELVKTDMKKMAAQQQQLVQQQAQIKQQAISAAQVAMKPGEAATVADSTIFAMVTPPGKRAVTIMIESLLAVGGLVNPGDYVDVIAHLKIPQGQSKNKEEAAKVDTVTTVLFQSVQVLAIGANFKPVGNALVYDSQTKAKELNVTLALDPEQASLITFAGANGKLQLSLRSPAEKGTHLLEVASWDSLSQYVLDHQGTELNVPSQQQFSPEIKSSGDSKRTDSEVKPFIQIYRGGQAL